MAGNTKLGSEEAYRFTRGEDIETNGEKVRISRPLDFLAVTDHAESLGSLVSAEMRESVLSASETGKMLQNRFDAAQALSGDKRTEAFSNIVMDMFAKEKPVVSDEKYRHSAWGKLTAAADLMRVGL